MQVKKSSRLFHTIVVVGCTLANVSGCGDDAADPAREERPSGLDEDEHGEHEHDGEEPAEDGGVEHQQGDASVPHAHDAGEPHDAQTDAEHDAGEQADGGDAGHDTGVGEHDSAVAGHGPDAGWPPTK